MMTFSSARLHSGISILAPDFHAVYHGPPTFDPPTECRSLVLFSGSLLLARRFISFICPYLRRRPTHRRHEGRSPLGAVPENRNRRSPIPRHGGDIQRSRAISGPLMPRRNRLS